MINTLTILSLLLILILMFGFNYFQTYNSGVYWNAILILFRQSISIKKIKTNSMIILLFAWILFCTLLTAIYSNSIYSLMINSIKSKTIDSIEELANAQTNGKIIVSVIDNVSHSDVLRV